MSTVNGRTLNEVLRDLRVHKDATFFTPDGHPYYKTAEFVSAFDNIVGVANYNVEYTDHSFRQISTGQELFSVKCIITIIDDDGKPVLKRECYGGYVCKYAKQSGNDVNLQNSLDFVCSYAFKNAAKRFGVFGLKTTAADEDKHKIEERKNGNDAAKTSKEKKPTCVVEIYAKKPFERKDDNCDRPTYYLHGYTVDENNKSSGQAKIIFYPNLYSKYADELNTHISKCLKPEGWTRMRILVSPCESDKSNVPTYVFKGFRSA